MDEERAEPESLADYGYTAFEKWDYEPFVYVQEENKPWVSFKAGKMTRAFCQCGNSYLETRAILILGAGNRLRYARCHFPPRRIPNESRRLSANSFALFAMRTDVRAL